MSVLRQPNFLGQQRLDVPHLRGLVSATAADFDLLAGRILAGEKPLVIKGFELVTAGAVGSPATDLQLLVADSIAVHYFASEHGSIFSVPADQPVEVLNSTNARLDGGFVAGQVNYLGLDLRREADASTVDLVMFIDASSRLEIPKTVPLARTLKYRLVVSTVDFGSTPYVLPIAKVTTDNANVVTALEDARFMSYRLGAGGSVPDPFSGYSWPAGRAENLTGNVFVGGDKGITSAKDWQDAVMTRIWEIGGGQHWYSPSSDRELRLVGGNPVIAATSDNFQWTLGTDTLQWQSLQVVFGNSAVPYNVIDDGSAVLLDNQVLYVDIDRTSIATLTPQVADLTSLGQSATPGQRVIIVWRRGNEIFVRDRPYELGRTIPVANTLVSGTVKLKYAAVSPTDPIVLAMQTNGTFVNTADGGNASAFTGTGNGTGAGFDGLNPGFGPGVRGTSAGSGVTGIGTGNGRGGTFTGSGSGNGILVTGGNDSLTVAAIFQGGTTNGYGMRAIATGAGVAGQFQASSVSGDAIHVTTGILRVHQLEDFTTADMLVGSDSTKTGSVIVGNVTNGVTLNGDVTIPDAAAGSLRIPVSENFGYNATRTLRKVLTGYDADIIAHAGTPTITVGTIAGGVSPYLGKASDGGGNAIRVYGQFALPKGAIITQLLLKVTHGGSAVSGGSVWIEKVAPGSAGTEFVKSAVLSTGTMSFAAGSGSQDFALSPHATAANRTVSTDFEVFVYEYIGTGSGVNNFTSLQVTYTITDFLPENG